MLVKVCVCKLMCCYGSIVVRVMPDCVFVVSIQNLLLDEACFVYVCIVIYL
jgi:hypothetical protein